MEVEEALKNFDYKQPSLWDQDKTPIHHCLWLLVLTSFSDRLGKVDRLVHVADESKGLYQVGEERE